MATQLFEPEQEQEATTNGNGHARESVIVDRRVGSALKSVDIQGFRSFGPLAADIGHIDWLSPVTLILGANGTGKTTIIECLKFATTGEFPPNTNRGSAFVHDPKLSPNKEVRAQVCLKFFGSDGKEYVLTRTAEAKAVKNTRGLYDVKFKTLESTLYSFINGKKQTTPLTVDQAGQTMQSILGVSKPIINSVIFCHQEEADWPLDQAGKLKEKFDEIFAATKYTKALDEFRELKKKDKTELDIAKERRDQKMLFRDDAQRKTVELQEIQQNRDTVMKSIEELQEQLNAHQAKNESLQQSLESITKLEKDLGVVSVKLTNVTKSIADLEARLGEEYPGTTEDLEREIRDSKNIDADKRAKLTETVQKQKALDMKISELRKSLTKANQSIGTLRAEVETNKANITERNKKMNDLAKTYGMKMYMQNVEYLPGEIESFESDYSQRMKVEEDKLDEYKKTSATEVDDLTSRVAEKKAEQENLLKAVNKLKKEVQDKSLREITVADELADIDSQTTSVEAIEAKITTESELLTSAESEMNVEDARKKISDDMQKKKDLTAKLKVLKTAVQQKEKQHSLFTQLDMLNSQMKEKQDNIDKQRHKITAFLDKFGLDLANEEIKSTLESKLRESNTALEDAKKAMSKAETSIAVKEKERSHARNELESIQSKIKEFENRLEELCGGKSDIKVVQNSLEEEINKWRSEIAEMKGKTHVFKSFKDSLARKDVKPCCPTCHRSFNDDAEATELVEELDTSIRDLPDRIAAQEKKIAEGNKKRDKLVEFFPEVKKAEQMRKKAVDLEERLKTLSEDIANLVAEKNRRENGIEDLTSVRQLCMSSQSDILKLDSLLIDLRKNEKEQKSISAKMSSGSDDRGLEEVKKEREDAEAEFENLSKTLDELRESLSTHENKINKLKDSINKLRDQKLKITERMQEKLKLEHQLSELRSDIARAKAEQEELVQKEAPIRQVLETFNLQKKRAHDEWAEKICVQDDLVDNMKDGERELQRLNKKIKEFERKGVDEKLQNLLGDINSMNDEIKRKESEREEYVEDIRRMEKDLDSVASRGQILKDNLSLRQNREELKTVTKEHDELKEKLSKEDPPKVREELKKVTQEIKDTTKKLHTQQGRKTELDKALRAKEKELELPHYKNAQKEFSNAAITCQVLDMAMKDVEKFYRALDFAVMKFHSTKMGEINKIIRDLWQNTYQGNDIDYIEIRSDAENNGIEGDKSRRNYNYRVVMVSGETALDMRGRCSAGQRVLACLIIRLALAEAFAMNCGILALDEPTTNLDRDNIEHLAKSLSSLIRTHRNDASAHRFQLVIITHDSEFLNMLNTASTGPLVDSYYKIWKEQGGKSRLKKVNYTGHF